MAWYASNITLRNKYGFQVCHDFVPSGSTLKLLHCSLYRILIVEYTCIRQVCLEAFFHKALLYSFVKYRIFEYVQSDAKTRRYFEVHLLRFSDLISD